MFKPGDVVRLKAGGGPEMTVAWRGYPKKPGGPASIGPLLHCKWAVDGKIAEGDFPEENCERVLPPAPSQKESDVRTAS